MSIYAELQQACSRAAEVKASGKRHLGSYFRVVFIGKNHFGYFLFYFFRKIFLPLIKSWINLKIKFFAL